MKKIALSIADILFPPICLNCDAAIADQKRLLCENCFAHIECNTSFFCAQCGARRMSIADHCHTQETPYLLASATAYEDPMPALIRYFKYGKLYPLEFFLSALLCAYLNRLSIPLNRYTFTYIPLHFWKERKRGFNQSRALAQRVADYFHRPYIQLLTRVKATDPQAKLPFEKRKENIKDCFICVAPEKILNKDFIIVDDVSTTGATLREACDVLKQHGAHSIIALVVSRA